MLLAVCWRREKVDMSTQLTFGIIFLVAGAACFYCPNELRALDNRQLPWGLPRPLTLSSINVKTIRLAGAVITVYGALVIWLAS
jgi:uncharacterized protein YjeT (DUF2065 family)